MNYSKVRSKKNRITFAATIIIALASLMGCDDAVTVQEKSLMGTSSSGGQPAIFEMPKNNFSYSCQLIFRTYIKQNSFVWATKQIVVQKADFEILGPPGNASLAVATFTSDERGWSLSVSNNETPPSLLPESLRGHEVQLTLQMGPNVSNLSGVVSAVSLRAHLPQEIMASSISDYIAYDSVPLMSTDLSFQKTQSRTSFVGLAAKCRYQDDTE